MNKLFTKIVGLALGLTMAIGVGVAVASSREAVPVNAASDTLAMSALSSSDSNISAVAAKSTGSNVPITATVNSQSGVRMYANNTLTITASNNANITSLTIPWYKNGSKTFASVSVESGGGTYTHAASSGNSGTWTGSSSEVVLKIGSSGQIQLYEIQYTTAAAKTLSSIALSGTYPTTFTQGDEFSHSGMTVTATYSDSATADVTSSATFSGYNMSTTGDQTVTVSYTEGGVTETATYGITVSAAITRNVTALTITTASDTTTFTVGDTFDVGSLVITATFDAAPTIVVYSKANDNLAALEASPEIGYEFVEGDIGSMSAEFQLSVGTGTKSVSYTITVVDKDYATVVTDLDSLWDGQKVYFSNGTNVAMNKYSSGNNVGASSATIDSTKGLDIAGTSGYAYTVHRMKVDSTVYYLFSLEESGTTYYIKDTGNSNTNSINKVTDISDTAICWTLSAGSNDGQWTITNRSNTTKAYLQINPNNGNPLLSCYNGGQTNPYLYAVTSYSESAVASDFATGAMHMSENTSGQCVDYYPIAKQVWNAMSEYERLYVDVEQPLAYARLVAWATYHGETINGSYNIVSASRISILNTFIVKNENIVAIIVVISMISVTAIGGYFFLKKRKEQ